ncbi:MAG: AI-2E family transporter, partial [Anaerolineales bacterium]|nr:AI-2E family transporter [Anaerolineales bacterium]
MTDQNQQGQFRSPPWQPATRLVVAILAILFGILLLYLLRSLVIPVIFAFLFAYMLHPLTCWVTAKTRIPKGIVAFLALLLSAVLILSLTTGLGMAFSQRIVALASYLSSIVEQLPTMIESLADQTIIIWNFEIDLREMNISPLLTNLASSLSPLLTRAGSLIGSFAVAAVTGVTTFLLMIVMSFYFLMDFEKFRPGLHNIIPASYQQDFDHLLTQTNRIWRAFLRGQVVLGVIVGVITWALMSIVGLDFPIAVGAIAGFMELIPMFGPVITGVFATLIALFQPLNPWGLTPLEYSLLIIGIFFLIQQVENIILVPRIMGESLDLHPLVVCIAVLAGGILAGFVGVLLASPVVATLRLGTGYLYSKVVEVKPPRSEVVKPCTPGDRPEYLSGWIKRLRNRFQAGE